MLKKNRLPFRVLAGGLLAGCVVVAMVHADDNSGPPGGDPPGAAQQGGGGQQGGRPPAGFHLIPRFAEQQLNLTDDQKKQIADLEKQTQAKLAKILTADQMKTLDEARPPRPGGGQGGPGGGGQGAQGNQGGSGGGDQGGPPPGN